MSERLIHQRSKGPASTPAARLVELQNALAAAERDLAEERAAAARLALRLERFQSLSGTSFGGIPCAQIYADFVLWESILNENPQLDAIFEIGTWKGGFSWFLHAQAQARNIFFQTYDAIEPERFVPDFQRRDVFADRKDLGRRFRDWEPCVVFCDGGNKPRELREFAEELVDPGSLLVVHDWGTEMLPENVPDTVVEAYGDFCDQIGSMSRVFRLRETADAEG